MSETVCSIEGCGNPCHSRGWCRTHYHRWSRHGNPITVLRSKYTPAGELMRFFTEVVLNHDGEDCLPWPYGCIDGYGVMKGRYVSRLVCEAVNGPPPTPEHVAAHSCGKGHLGCVAKKHIRWATQKENIDDKKTHGTQLRGSSSPGAKLSEAAVLSIRSLFGVMPQTQIAAKFGVSKSTISWIKLGRVWSWLK